MFCSRPKPLINRASYEFYIKISSAAMATLFLFKVVLFAVCNVIGKNIAFVINLVIDLSGNKPLFLFMGVGAYGSTR